MTADFESWLLQQNYRSSTARKSVQDVARLKRWYADGFEPGSDSDMQAVRRYADYLREAKPGTRDPFDTWVRGLKLAPLPKLRKKAGPQQQTQSLSDEDWKVLVSVLRSDESPCGTVLFVMVATGHRIGDVLRLQRAPLQQGLRTGILQLERKGGLYVEVPVEGARPAWEALQRRWAAAPGPARTVADWVAPGGAWGAEAGGAAYKRVQRYLRQIASDNGLQGRVHLHRLRRTVGVRALGATKDIHAVQQLLGHRSIRSTEQYVSELRADDVAELQRKLLEETNR